MASVPSSGRQSKTSGFNGPADGMIPLDSILNLRRVDAHGRLYRSGKQDRASPEDTQYLHSLGIRTFFDLRSRNEYKNSKPRKIKPFDRETHVMVPHLPNPKTKPYPSTSAIFAKDLKGGYVSISESSLKLRRRRYLISMFSWRYYTDIYFLAPFYKRLFCLLLLLVDFIFGTRYKYFTRCYSQEVNSFGLDGLYFSFLEHGGKQLCFILKTMCDPDNLPAVLCCAHGKDRTGVVTALVLSILGKSADYIAEDYALSEEGLCSIRSTVLNKLTHRYYIDETFASAKKETMLKTLAMLQDRYGSVENYLESIGFGHDDQEKLRQVLS